MARNRYVIELESGDELKVVQYFGEAYKPYVRIDVLDGYGVRPIVSFEIDQDSALPWLGFADRVRAAVGALNLECARRNMRGAREEDSCTAP
jgi:hypothetical protein